MVHIQDASVADGTMMAPFWFVCVACKTVFLALFLGIFEEEALRGVKVRVTKYEGTNTYQILWNSAWVNVRGCEIRPQEHDECDVEKSKEDNRFDIA